MWSPCSIIGKRGGGIVLDDPSLFLSFFILQREGEKRDAGLLQLVRR